MSKVSVIVPIYNVSAYIERCARSLFEQTLDDIEYIFINDCTLDNSMVILEKVLNDYPHRKQQTRILKMSTNSRQAAVRRHGIKLASGEFIIHCDADDWVDVDLYEKMYNEATCSNADIVICPIRDEYKNRGINRPVSILPKISRDILKDWYCKPVGMFAWNKLVRRAIYTNYNILPYEGINMWEDNGLFLRIFYYAQSVSTINDALYHYNRTNSSAMTNGYGRDAVEQMIECARRIDSFFRSQSDFVKFEKTVLALKFFARVNLVTDSFVDLHRYYKLFPESNKIISLISLTSFSKRGKIRFLFVKYKLAWLFVILYKIKKYIKI